jgi:hypothetical protein
VQCQMGVVVERVDLSVTGGTNLDRGAGVKTLAFCLLTRNQMVFAESGHLSVTKFAGLRHCSEMSGWWATVTRNLILAIALPVQHYQPNRFTSNTQSARIDFMNQSLLRVCPLSVVCSPLFVVLNSELKTQNSKPSPTLHYPPFFVLWLNNDTTQDFSPIAIGIAST